MEECTTLVPTDDISVNPETIREDQSNPEGDVMVMDRKPSADSSQSSASTLSTVVHEALSEGNHDAVLNLKDSDAQEALDVMQKVS